MIVYKKVDSSFLRYLVVLFFTMVTMFSDWPLVGVLLIFGFYRWKNTKWEIQLPIIYTTFILMSMRLLIYVSSPQSRPFSQVFSGLGMLLVIPLLFAYNGKRGYSPSWVKWGFYNFYPLHLVALALIRLVIQWSDFRRNRWALMRLEKSQVKIFLNY